MRFDQLIYDRRRRDCLPRARGALDQGQRALEGVLHCIHLRPVQVGQVGRGKVSWQLSPEENIVNIVSKQPVVDVSRDRAVVHCKLSQGRLHPVKTGAFPHKVDHKVGAAARRSSLVAFQLPLVLP